MEELPGMKNRLIFLCTVAPEEYAELTEPLLASQDRNSLRLAYLSAAIRNPGDVQSALSFIEQDADRGLVYRTQPVSSLIASARHDDIDALTLLGGLYRNTPSIHKGDPYYMNLGESLLNYTARLCRSKYDKGHGGEQYLRKWYHLESAVRDDQETALGVFQIGLDNWEPSFCAEAYWFKDDLDLTDHQVGQYLSFAEKHGYSIDAAMMDIRSNREKAFQQARAAEKKAQEELDARRQALSDELDWLERDWDYVHGGSGHTLGEKALAGRLTPEQYAEFLRNQDRRNAYINRKIR